MNNIYCVGVGPGDPDLLTIKAARIISEARQIAYFRKKNTLGRARFIIDSLISTSRPLEYAMEYPITNEINFRSDEYKNSISEFYDNCANKLRELLVHDNVVVISEGDPLFYGSFVHLFKLLKQDINIEFVPGITAMSGAWNNARLPIAMGEQPLTILMGIQSEEELRGHLESSKNVVIMKIGTHLKKVKSVIAETGNLSKALVIEKATMPEQGIFPLMEYTKSKAPYFSIILISEEHYE